MPGETLITDGATTATATTATEATASTTATTSTTTATGETTGETAQSSSTTGEKAGEGGEAGAKTPEQIAADEAAARAAEEAAAAKAGAPEKYEPFKAPEGTALDPAIATKFEETARALNLPQDKAQQLIDQMAPVMAQQHAQQMEQLRADWKEQSSADKEFGGDKLPENLGYARKALDTFATPELKTILNETGLGNHPELVRFMVRAGKAISEDKIVMGGAPASANRSAAEVLYGGDKK
jgi:hypothetical protein